MNLINAVPTVPTVLTYLISMYRAHGEVLDMGWAVRTVRTDFGAHNDPH